MTSENPHFKGYQKIETALENDGTKIPMSSENLPIEERCGVEEIDAIAVGLLVLAPLDTVAEVVAQLGARWERDVYNQTIQGCGLLVFQFRGHPWTGILDGSMTDGYRNILNSYVSDYWNWQLQAQSLSQKLRTRTIYYWVSDSNGSIGYAYWENGELMERLEYEDATWEYTHDEALWEAPDRPFDPHLFESKVRQLTATEIEDSYYFIDNFLCEQHAYAATRLSTFYIKRDDFVRLDYIAFA